MVPCVLKCILYIKSFEFLCPCLCDRGTAWRLPSGSLVLAALPYCNVMVELQVWVGGVVSVLRELSTVWMC